MFEMSTARLHVYCRDCGQPMAVIQQEDLDGSHLTQVTCWQASCLLHGFTLTLNRYQNLEECELDLYREMNRIYVPAYVRVDG